MRGLLSSVARIAERRAERRRRGVAEAMTDAGVEEVRIEGELARLAGRGLPGRWLNDLALREAGRRGP